MKVFSYEFSDQEKAAWRGAPRRLKRTFIKLFIGSVIAFSVVSGPIISTAHAHDPFRKFIRQMTKVVDPWRLSGGVAGAALGSKKDSDVERGAKVAGGVIAGEVVHKTLEGRPIDVGDTLIDAGSGFIGGMIRSDKDSDSEAMLKAAAVIGGVRFIKRAVEINAGGPESSYSNGYGSDYQPGDRTSCHRVVKRVYRNGKLVEDRIEEVCSSRAERRGYGVEPTPRSYRRGYGR